MAKAKKLPSGNWRVNLYDYTDPSTGKRIYKSFTATTKKEAEYMAAEYKLDGKQRTASAGDMTLKEAYTRYIDSKTNVLSPSTIREYRRSARNDLQDIMPLKLRDITQEAVQRSINQFAANRQIMRQRPCAMPMGFYLPCWAYIIPLSSSPRACPRSKRQESPFRQRRK